MLHDMFHHGSSLGTQQVSQGFLRNASPLKLPRIDQVDQHEGDVNPWRQDIAIFHGEVQVDTQ